MKTHQIKVISIRKFYLLIFFGTIISVVLLIALISLIVYFIPEFDYINLLIIIYSIAISYLMSKIITNLSSKLIEIKINKKILEIDSKQYPIESIDKIGTNNFPFTYFPKFTFYFFENKKVTFRIDRSEKDYSKLLFNLNEFIKTKK